MTVDAENEISLNLDESNELLFKVSIVGTQAITEKPVARLVYENKEEISFLFEGTMIENDNVKFVIPVLEKKIKPGKYNTKLEVVIGNKILAPLNMITNFIEPAKVVVESVLVNNKTNANKNTQEKQTSQATASLVSVKKQTGKFVQARKPEQKAIKEVLKKIIKEVK